MLVLRARVEAVCCLQVECSREQSRGRWAEHCGFQTRRSSSIHQLAYCRRRSLVAGVGRRWQEVAMVPKTRLLFGVVRAWRVSNYVVRHLGLGVVCNALSTVSEGWVVLGRSDVF